MSAATNRNVASCVRSTNEKSSSSANFVARIRVALLISSLIGVLLLNLKYITGPHYDYLGFSFTAGSTARILGTLVAALAPIALIPMSCLRPSSLVFTLLYLVVYIPSCVVPAFTEDGGIVSAGCLQAALLCSFVVMLAAHKLFSWTAPTCEANPSTFWSIVLGGTGFTLWWTIRAFGFSFSIPSFAEVYSIRDSHVELLQQGSRGLVYLIGWLANVINPMLLAFYWVRRRYVALAAVVMTQLWLFSISGYKTYLLTLPFVACVMLAARLTRPGATIQALSASMLGLLLISSAADFGSNNCNFSNVFVRRLLLTPGRQTYWYYDFFSENPKALLGHSVLKGVVDYPYEAPPPKIIGERHFKTYDANANGNLWADAYANFGFAGMVGFSAMLGGFCWLYDQASRGVHRQVAFSMLAMPAASLCNSPLLTTMLTHGLGLSLLLVLVFPRYSTDPATSDKSQGRARSKWSRPSTASLDASFTSRPSTSRMTSASRTNSAPRSAAKATRLR